MSAVLDIKPAEPKPKPTGLALLREPFPDNQVKLKPQPVKKDDQDKGVCENTAAGRKYSADRQFCGGYHARSIHLSYVGHAALTDRLLEADPQWCWEPLAIDETGLPRLSKDGLLWIRLTVCGVTRLGVGDAPGNKGAGNEMKERIGDALRNAALRFGAALEYWHRGDLHAEEPEPDPINGDPTVGNRDIPTDVDYPADRFATNFASWEAVIKDGRRKVADVVKMIESGGYKLTQSQRARLEALAPKGPS